MPNTFTQGADPNDPNAPPRRQVLYAQGGTPPPDGTAPPPAAGAPQWAGQGAAAQGSPQWTAQGGAQGAAPDAAAATPAASAGASASGSPGAGWTQVNGGWVPPDHPLAHGAAHDGGSPGSQSGGPGPMTNSYASPTAAAQGSSTVQGQAQSAATYSSTPGAAPTANTTNQGAQDVYRNSLLQRATQSTDVDMNNPALRQVMDTHAAGDERARREAVDMSAESAAGNGMGSSGQLDNEKRMAAEKSAQSGAGFAGQLAMGELQNKRSEIANALSELGTSIGGDQARALQDKLAQLDATIRKQSIDQTGAIGMADIGLRRDLGMGDLNLRGTGLLLNNQQQNNNLGATIGMSNADRNAAALRAVLGRG